MKYFTNYFALINVKIQFMSDIERLRTLLNMTQESFASKLGVTARTIQNWESGKVIPKSKLSILKDLAAKFPNEPFTIFEATDSPGAGVGNDVSGISSVDLKRILDEMGAQRKDYMNQIDRKDRQIESLIEILKTKI